MYAPVPQLQQACASGACGLPRGSAARLARRLAEVLRDAVPLRCASCLTPHGASCCLRAGPLPRPFLRRLDRRPPGDRRARRAARYGALHAPRPAPPAADQANRAQPPRPVRLTSTFRPRRARACGAVSFSKPLRPWPSPAWRFP